MTRYCATCGEPFPCGKKVQFFCSPECRKRDRQKRWEARYRDERCAACGRAYRKPRTPRNSVSVAGTAGLGDTQREEV